jgi:hypothetical protein
MACLAQPLISWSSDRLSSNLRLPNRPNAAFVGTLYEQALGRAPEPQGLAGWTGAMNANLLNNVGVAIGIAESPEAQQFLSSKIENGWHLA